MSKKKSEQLGMSFSTASHQLRKQIMFNLIQMCELDICYQCGNIIQSANEMSIEHKKAWQDSENPKELFFDLKNIAFSHLSCNSANGRRVKKVERKKTTLVKNVGRSGYIGVVIHDNYRTKKYQAKPWLKGKSKSLGYYITPEDAAEAVDKALIECYGDKAKTNRLLGLLK